MKPGLSQASSKAKVVRLSRRQALKVLGGGIVVSVFLPSSVRAQEKLPSAYLQIAADGSVTIFTGKVEYGQGIMTSLAQMAAEELDVPLSSMRVVLGDTQLCPADPDGGTWGSLTTRNFGPPLRTAAARARAVLVELASKQLGLPIDQLFTQNGAVISKADNAVRVSYASLAGGKSVEAHLSQTPRTKAFSQFTISSKSALRLDAVEKVTGQAKFTADIRLPGMLYARIVRPPAHGATLKSVDTSAAEKIPGVRVVRIGSLVAVLHEQPDVANRAWAAVVVQYDAPQTGQDEETVYSYLVGRYPTGQTYAQRGNVVTGEAQAVSKVELTYYTPYVEHSPIEPHAAVVSIEGTKATVWASTQTPSGVRSDVAVALGFSSANVRVITPYIGGAFGGKASHQQAVEAAQLAKAAGKPVSLNWTREEEFFYDRLQCPSITKTRAGLDANKKIIFWDSQIYCVGGRGATMFYDVPNHRIRTYGNYDAGKSVHPFDTGPWRAPGNNANTFTRESHFDALAAAAGVDPVQFRLTNLQNTRVRNALLKAAEAFRWSPAPGPSGRGFGVACGEDAGACVVMMAEVDVDRATGEVKVKRMLCSQDMGQAINPEGARMQMEGCMMMGLGYALSEELHFKNGAIQDLNFHRYRIPCFSWLPKLETVIVENNTLSPQGGGEPAIITVGAVLANAVFDAIGVRPTRLPMTPARVLDLVRQSSLLVLRSPSASGNQVQLSWNGGPGIKLQKAATLTNPAWQDVPDTDGKSSVSLPMADASAYFRVVKP